MPRRKPKPDPADAAYRAMVRAVRAWVAVEHPNQTLITVTGWDRRGGGEDLASFRAFADQFSQGDVRAAGGKLAGPVRDLFCGAD